VKFFMLARRHCRAQALSGLDSIGAGSMSTRNHDFERNGGSDADEN